MAGHRSYREHRYEFGKQLLTLRTRVSLTQLELAEQVGVHRRSVQNWESGDAYPKADLLQRMVALFLEQGAFTKGRERDEAFAFWQQAMDDGAHELTPFDDLWFRQLLPSSLPP